MNITFRSPSEELDKKFVSEAARLEMDGLKGHRNAGGMRASIYNAFPRKGCDVLAASSCARLRAAEWITLRIAVDIRFMKPWDCNPRASGSVSNLDASDIACPT